MSKATAIRIKNELLELELERLSGWAAELLGESVNDDVESWEPYEIPEDWQPTEPFYTEQSLRDKAARKAARQKRKDAAE